MIWNAKNTKKVLVDVYGNQVPLVHEYNDETNEATIMLKGTNGKLLIELDTNNQRQIATATLILKGAKLINKV